MPITFKGKTYQPRKGQFFVSKRDPTDPYFDFVKATEQDVPNLTRQGYIPVGKEEATSLINQRLASLKPGEPLVQAFQQHLANIQKTEEFYDIPELGFTNAPRSAVESEISNREAFGRGELINLAKTGEIPRYAPRGTPTPEEDNKDFQAKQPPPTYQEYDPKTGQVKTITPTPGTGDYIPDVVKGFQQQITPGGVSAATPIVETSARPRAEITRQKIEEIKALIEPQLGKPATLRSVEEFDRLRKEQGVVNDEGELSAIQNEALQLRQAFRQFESQQGRGVTEAGRIGAITEEERNLSFRMESLAIREQGILARLNSKNAYISNVLQLKQQDYNTIRGEYEFEYNKNVKAIDLYNNQLDDQKKDALTGFTTIANLFKDKNIDLNSIDSKLKTQIDSLALQAGLPTGLFEAFASAHPDQKILAPITVKNASGGEDVYFFTQDPKTGQPSLIQTVGLQGVGDTSGEGAATIYGFTPDGKPITYLPGKDATVDAWVQLIQSGQNKLTDIPGTTKAGSILRNKVTVALAALGSSSEGRPTTTELGKESLAIAKDLKTKLGRGGSAAVGGTSIFNKYAIPGSARTDFIKTFDTLKSKLSLEGVKYLKGQGQVSDAERRLLSEAVSNLYLETSEKQFKTALDTIINKLEGNSIGSYSITAPDENTYTFNSQAELDAFKKEAGLQ